MIFSKEKISFSCNLFTFLMTFISVIISAGVANANNLLEMSLEDLLNVQVTTVSKAPNSLLESAAAIYVIDQDDIQRSGANSIPELLKMVPGMSVAQLDSNKWAISARGFNGQFANKLLVMIDGRSVYTPVFSGVYWDTLDLVLAEIERIEVIRGPGAALWGANAVNGVINIITRTAMQTLGTEATAWGGTEENVGFSLIQSVMIGSDDFLRLSAKTSVREESRLNGSGAEDDMRMAKLGFRWDHTTAQWSAKTTGSFYQSRAGSNFDRISSEGDYHSYFNDDTDTFGGHLLTNWDRALSSQSQLSLQFYYDYSYRDEAFYESETQVLDAEVQYAYSFTSGQKLTLGLNLRTYFDDLTAIENTSINPAEREYGFYSLYLQDEIPLTDNLKLIVGSKVENNDLTDWEIQPNIRLAWFPRDNLTLWGAISKAVRTPSRMDVDGQILVKVYPAGHESNPTTLPGFYYFTGSGSFEAEELIAYEVGLRHLISDHLSTDFTLFYNDYDNLRTGTDPSAEPVFVDGMPAYLKLTGDAVNTLKGQSYGFEAAVKWQVNDDWKLIGSYSFMEMDFEFDGELEEFLNSLYARHQGSLQSHYNLTGNVQFDSWLTYTGKISAQEQPEIWDLDLRLGWQVNPQWQLELIGQNLLHDSQRQLNSEVISMVSTEIERGFFMRASCQF
jgi:iron complex outermembrane recepter protein